MNTDMKDKINTDSQQKTALADGFTSSLTRFVNNTELDPKNTSILTNYVNFVKSEDSVDPTGIEPVRPIFLGSAPKPGGPTPSFTLPKPNNSVYNPAINNETI